MRAGPALNGLHSWGSPTCCEKLQRCWRACILTLSWVCAGDCVSRANQAVRYCPPRQAEVQQFAAFMAVPRTPAQQQALIDRQAPLLPACCAAMRGFQDAVRALPPRSCRLSMGG